MRDLAARKLDLNGSLFEDARAVGPGMLE